MNVDTEQSGLVDVYRGRDALLVEHLHAALEEQGIRAQVHGVQRGADVGAGEEIARIKLMVTAADAKQALQIIADHAASAAAVPFTPRPRRRLFALVASIILPGLAQTYVGRRWSGIPLAAACLIAAGIVTRRAAQLVDASSLPLILVLTLALAMDQFVSQRAIGSLRTGDSEPSREQQQFHGAVQGAIMLAIPVIARLAGI